MCVSKNRFSIFVIMSSSEGSGWVWGAKSTCSVWDRVNQSCQIKENLIVKGFHGYYENRKLFLMKSLRRRICGIGVKEVDRKCGIFSRANMKHVYWGKCVGYPCISTVLLYMHMCLFPDIFCFPKESVALALIGVAHVWDAMRMGKAQAPSPNRWLGRIL